MAELVLNGFDLFHMESEFSASKLTKAVRGDVWYLLVRVLLLVEKSQKVEKRETREKSKSQIFRAFCLSFLQKHRTMRKVRKVKVKQVQQ